MPNALQVFSFIGRKVRVVEQDGEFWFVATDVCRILGYSNVTDALNKHVEKDERATLAIREGAQYVPSANVISEPGLYGLILGSKKPQAKEFSRWVKHEVLPTLRKTGTYTMRQASEDEAVQQDERRGEVAASGVTVSLTVSGDLNRMREILEQLSLR